MIPAYRVQADLYEIPKFNIQKRNIEEFVEELKGFHEEFRDCFLRQEPRERFFQYMVGQLSQLERKSIEPIALNVEGGKVRAMQFFISNALWNEKRMVRKYRALANEDMGDPEGVLIFDETGFVKKGNDSAGVARQYCGSLGKVENCHLWRVCGLCVSSWVLPAGGSTLYPPEMVQ
jgi:SRSO17 transposase